MSLFFIGQRRRDPPVELVPDLEAALQAASEGKGTTSVALAGSIVPSRADHIVSVVMQIEPMLLSLIADGTLTTKTSAVDWVREHTDAFPAAKFVDVLIANAGGTWLKLKAEAPKEVPATAAIVAPK
jgi:hypothetical protein